MAGPICVCIDVCKVEKEGEQGGSPLTIDTFVFPRAPDYPRQPSKGCNREAYHQRDMDIEMEDSP